MNLQIDIGVVRAVAVVRSDSRIWLNLIQGLHSVKEPDAMRALQMHSSLVQRLDLEKVMEVCSVYPFLVGLSSSFSWHPRVQSDIKRVMHPLSTCDHHRYVECVLKQWATPRLAHSG